LQDMKMQDTKMTDQKWRQGVKWREKKSRLSSEITLQWIVQIFKPTTLIHSAYVIIYFWKTSKNNAIKMFCFSILHIIMKHAKSLLSLFCLKRSPLVCSFVSCYFIPAFSCPAISCHANWSVNFTSVIFNATKPNTTARAWHADYSIVIVISDRHHICGFHNWTDVWTVCHGRNVKTCQLEGLSRYLTAFIYLKNKAITYYSRLHLRKSQ